jgi:hypothetical protein
MKAALCGISALGAGGIYMLAGSPGPDFDRVVNKPPMTVYAAFSALGPAGTFSDGPTGDMRHRITRRVEKTPGQEIHYEILLDDRPVVDVDLHFAPGPEDKGTRLTAEFDLDAYALGSTYETEAGIALSMVPDGYIDHQFASFMEHRVADIEAGRPLPPFDLASSGMRRPRPRPGRRRWSTPTVSPNGISPGADASQAASPDDEEIAENEGVLHSPPGGSC